MLAKRRCIPPSIHYQRAETKAAAIEAWEKRYREPKTIPGIQQCPSHTAGRAGSHNPPDSLNRHPERRTYLLSPGLSGNSIHTNSPHYRSCFHWGIPPQIPPQKPPSSNRRGNGLCLRSDPRRYGARPPTLPSHTQSAPTSPVCGRVTRLAEKAF